MYVLLLSIARNIVFVVIVISHDYSLPLSKLFCLKGSMNLKERRGNFLKVSVKVVRSKWFTSIERNILRGVDKSLARSGRKQATATEDFEFHISYL